jgi:hypothetical protein
MSAKYTTIEAAQKAADIRDRALKLTDEWLKAEIRNCEYQLQQWQAKLETYRKVEDALDRNRDLAAKAAV